MTRVPAHPVGGREPGHDPLALAAAGIGILAAFGAGALGAGTLAVAFPALALGLGRGRGWRISRALIRPRLFALLGGIYLPIFLVDVFVSRSNPVGALARLVVFLLAADVLSGDPRRSHRPVLMGMLLVMVAAGETTDLWFLAPLVGFTLLAIAAQVRATTAGDRSAHGRGVAAVPSTLAVFAPSLMVASALFMMVPRGGAFWTQRGIGRLASRGPETGLGDSVNLGVIGNIKRSTTTAWRGRVVQGGLDPTTAYWKAQVFERWTGSGWTTRSGDGRGERIELDLPAGVAVEIPGGEAPGPAEAGLSVVELRRVRSRGPFLITAGRAAWLRSHRSAVVLAGRDGTLRGSRGEPPRRYMFAGAPEGVDRTGATGASGTDPTWDRNAPPVWALLLQRPESLQPQVAAWAASVAPATASWEVLAEAFMEDLARRPYSLDTTGIDPADPLGSFLRGAPAHCEYFASAMAVGLRLRNVPSRVVAGYLGAEPLLFGGEFLIRESRAHLWVEAYLPGRGWVLFDPTPAAGRLPPAGALPGLRAALDRAVVLWDSWVIGLDLEDQRELFLILREGLAGILGALRDPRVALAAPAAVLACALCLLGIATRRARRRRGESDLPDYYARLLRLAGRRGLRLAPGETAREFASRAGPSLGEPRLVRDLTLLYERQRFSGARIGPEEASRAVRLSMRLAAANRQGRQPIPRSPVE